MPPPRLTERPCRQLLQAPLQAPFKAAHTTMESTTAAGSSNTRTPAQAPFFKDELFCPSHSALMMAMCLSAC